MVIAAVLWWLIELGYRAGTTARMTTTPTLSTSPVLRPASDLWSAHGHERPALSSGAVNGLEPESDSGVDEGNHRPIG